MKKFIFATDLHGDMQNPETVAALYEFTKIYKPHVRIFGGDLFDFRNFRKGASPEEREMSLRGDIEMGLEFLKIFRPHVFLRGNHDERLWDSAKHGKGVLRDWCEMAVKQISTKVRAIKCKMYPYDSRLGIYDLGKLRFVHGYNTGVYATRTTTLVFAPEGGAVLHGHNHAFQSHTVSRVSRTEGYGVGALVNTDMEYNRNNAAKLMHGNGWAYGYIDGDEWEVFMARKGKDDKWRVATNLKTIG
jgi:hypothetical protein